MNLFFIHILDFCHVLEEAINTDRFVDKRKWLPLWYGNRMGYLPYETEEEKQKILNDPLFFGHFDKDGKAIITKEYKTNERETKLTTKNKFNLVV